ncbi:hypothetical protein B9Z55_016363 [Caenorhabditis nigoni]|uniref:Serpentine receptor class r-10 n=1 Tax=Caenorhabditis nigoni TaxID=1611254 RepID=A0A2G5T476_9PELO|nr:hypothetical protein B9Z55_016363 [Caenorhabditis nigoni]
MSNYEYLKIFVQWTSFLCSLVFNLILTFLIITKSPKKMGNYRWLMIYFSCFAIFFSTLDVIVGPFIHAHGTSACLLMRRSESEDVANVQYVLLILLCSCFGVTITFFAIHFVFRYFALERKGRISYFDGKYFLIWLAIPVVCGTVWGLALHFFVGHTYETTEYLRENILHHYNLEMKDVIYVGAFYWRTLENGEMELVISAAIAAGIMFSVKATSISVVCYYGFLSYRQISELPQEGESAFTKSLQKQLYKALVLQAMIPILFMYLPIGTFLILPAFNVNIESFSKLATLFYAVYPAVDPLPLFFIIDNYRIALKDEGQGEDIPELPASALMAPGFYWFALISCLIISIFGSTVNFYLFYKFLKRDGKANGFQKICLVKTLPNFVICFAFLLWVVPVTALDYTYSQLPYRLNSIIGSLAGSWAYLFKTCGYVYDPNFFCWRPEGLPCSDQLAKVILAMIYSITFSSNVFNVLTGARLLVNKMVGMNQQEAARRRKRWMIMFTQSVIQDCLHLVDIINATYLWELSDELWFQFLFLTLSFIIIYTLDG